jgi:hypothetical protein
VSIAFERLQGRAKTATAISEYSTLLDEIDAAKGRFLRQLNKALGMSLFDLLKDPNRPQNLHFLQLKDQDIIIRPGCDPQWINKLTSMSDISVHLP